MVKDLARRQFATTNINHFLFVPVTIGLEFLVALLPTTWHRSVDAARVRRAVSPEGGDDRRSSGS